MCSSWSTRTTAALLCGSTRSQCRICSKRLCLLPPIIPLHYSAGGRADRTGAATQIFILPLIGVLAVLGNTLLGGLFYRREQMASYLLWGGAALVEVLLWIGAMNLLRIG